MNALLAESSKPKDLFTHYLNYCSGTEVPPFFDRWALIVGLGAWLGRRVWVRHGRNLIYPNMYAMLIGAPGTKKSTAIKQVRRLLDAAGYQNFAAEKTSKEKFLLDLAGGADDSKDILDSPFDSDEDKEVFIAADEFNDFFGNNILEFVSMLGVLWDYSGQYKNRIKTGTSVIVNNPTVSVLGGNTEVTFANTFPPEVMGQGFFSRLIAVYTNPTGIKITWPRYPTEEETAELLEWLQNIRARSAGEIKFTAAAAKLIDKINLTWKPLADIKFAHYGNRRLGHLLKLVLVHAVTRGSAVAECCDVTYANTVLSHTEHFMPYAFAAFGQAKNSRLTYTVLQVIHMARVPPTFEEVWQLVQSEASSLNDLADVIRGLNTANRIMILDNKILPKRSVLDTGRADDVVDYRYLTDLEKSNV